MNEGMNECDKVASIQPDRIQDNNDGEREREKERERVVS